MTSASTVPDLFDGLQHEVGHRQVGEHGESVAGPADRGPADRQAVVEVVDRAVAGRVVEVDVLEHDDRVLAAQGAVHQPHVVEGRGRCDDPPARRGGEDAGRVHGVLGAVSGAHGDLAAQHQRDVAVAAEHVAGLADLVEQLVGGDPHEVGVHELDHRAGNDRRGRCRRPRPAKAFSLIGVPSTRSGYAAASPLVAPLVPPLSRWTSSPITTTRSSVLIRRPMTSDDDVDELALSQRAL